MTIKEFAEKLGMKVLTSENSTDKEVTGVYTCDLLSWVMSHANKGDAWITVHTHVNIVAVAVLTEIAVVIVPEDIGVEEATINKANQEGVAVLSSGLTAYEICLGAGRLLGK